MILTEELSVKKHYDVIVAGGGVAGVAAAVQAAREGKNVLLVEKSMKLGGLATLGLINLFVPMCNGRGKQIIKGMCEEFVQISIKYGYAEGGFKDFENGVIPEAKIKQYEAEGKKLPRYVVRFSAEIFALALTELCVNEGITLMFDSIISTPVYTTECGKIKVQGVVLETKSGREYYTADMFIDATGDGDLMYRAGIPTVERGNYHTFSGFMATVESCKKVVETGNIFHLISRITGGNANLYGSGHPEDIPLYYGTTSEEVNRFLIANQLECLEKVKQYDNNSMNVVTLPGMAQFRTTRRIDGAYVLKTDDAYKHFDDSVAAICDFDRRDFLFEVPYGTMYAPCASNVLTCGRSVAGDGYAWDVLRVIPPAIVTGQAAGFAAAMAIDAKCDVANIDIRRLQNKMEITDNYVHFDDADVPSESDETFEVND